MKAAFTIFFLHLCLIGIAQQHTSLTQYNENKFILNPAVAGFKKCDDLNFGTQLQWLGFEGAPELLFVSLTSRFNKGKENKGNVQGFGFYLAREREGIQEKKYLKIAYSYHFPLGKNYEASVGMFLGVHKVDYKGVSPHTPAGLVDPVFENMRSRYVFPEVSPGIFVQGKKLYGGLSVLQVYPAKYKHKLHTNLSPHLYLMGGYHLGEQQWTFTPSFLLSSVPSVPPTFDVTFSAQYQNKILFAVGGKYANSVYFSVHLRLLKWLKVAYSYGYPLTDISKLAANTQSITINISGCDSFEARPPFYCPAFR